MAGFGKMAASYADDPAMAHHFSHSTHVQALRDHPRFLLAAVVDPEPRAREAATSAWGIEEAVSHPSLVSRPEDVEVLVIASPPDARTGLLDAFPKLKGALVEKPIATSLAAAIEFAGESKRLDGPTVVNFPRRADETMQELASGGLEVRIGEPQCAFGVYGGGLERNGIHLIDLIDMLLGGVTAVQSLNNSQHGPAFVLTCPKCPSVAIQPLEFSFYREVGLDIWGTKGRLCVCHEGLTLAETAVAPHRYSTADHELSHDTVSFETTRMGSALYRLYDNLDAAIGRHEAPVSSVDNAIRAMSVIDAVNRSSAGAGTRVAT